MLQLGRPIQWYPVNIMASLAHGNLHSCPSKHCTKTAARD